MVRFILSYCAPPTPPWVSTSSCVMRLEFRTSDLALDILVIRTCIVSGSSEGDNTNELFVNIRVKPKYQEGIYSQVIIDFAWEDHV